MCVCVYRVFVYAGAHMYKQAGSVYVFSFSFTTWIAMANHNSESLGINLYTVHPFLGYSVAIIFPLGSIACLHVY